MDTESRVQTSDMLREIILNGDAWVTDIQDDSMSDTDTSAILLTVPALVGIERISYYMIALARFTGTGVVSLYEEPTVSDVGTAMTETAINRADVNTCPIVCTSNPTVSDNGTALETIRIEGSTVADQVSIGAAVNPAGVWQLAAGKTYLILFTAGGAGKFSAIVEMYKSVE
jgi:hypothetical protein